MWKLRTYAGFSFLAMATAIFYAFHSRGQFFPAMVYLSTSKICFVLLLNTALVIMCSTWQLLKSLFLGRLREAEVERLNEHAWREVFEILFALTIFRQDVSVGFLAMVTALLLLKALHWLAQKRVDYIETTPSVPVLSHVRIVSFLLFLFAVDCAMLVFSAGPLIRTRTPSVHIFFSFEYVILATTTVSTLMKYIFYVGDMLMDGQWEKKAVYSFYLELVSDLLHLSLYMLFFIVVFLNYGIPLHLIRELYETFRNFKNRIQDYVRYRKITSNMNERFPDATTEELNSSDAICIICREEMTAAKKLLCGHLFHVHCLRSWLERQQTCPTCRALIVPPENGQLDPSRQHGDLSGPHQRAIAGTIMQGVAGSDGQNVTQQQEKIQAAAFAASLYEKSFVYPPGDVLHRLQGQLFQSETGGSSPESCGPSTGETGTCTQPLENKHPAKGGAPPASSSSFHMPLSVYDKMATADPELRSSLVQAQGNLIRSQIKYLEAQLQILQKYKKEHRSGDDESSDPKSKGKAVAAEGLPPEA